MTNENASKDAAVIEFIAEGKEILERVSHCLQEVERNSGKGTPEQVSALYRDMHTLKGTAQLFGYQSISLVAHAMEACLDPLRKNAQAIPNRLLDSCLKNLDVLERLIRSIEEQGKEEIQSAELVAITSVLIDASTDFFGAEFKLTKDSVYISETEASKKVESPPASTSKPKITHDEAPRELPMRVAMVEVADHPSTDSQVSAPQTTAPHSVSDSTVRVQVSLLDRILNLVGELVLVRNQLIQYRTKIEDPDFLATSKTLDGVTSDLQGEVMKTRMQPIDAVVGKFNRMVRDIARDLNKKIDLTLEDSDTELDKGLLEAVKDPLTHIVRNSCDHGIERPEDRKKAGKPETGHLLIRSFHEGGQVVIEISDDGHGLNRQRIVAKALEKGLITEEKSKRMSDQEICDLIFLPGFSTASQVTSVSGRGVGMDVVRTNIEKIGGSVLVSSVYEKGTTLQLRIPLTLAIVPGLLVKSGKEKYVIPQIKLVELVRVSNDSNSGTIEWLQGRPMYRLRGALLPLYDLGELTGEKIANYDQEIYIVVLNVDGDYFGLLVHEILDTADIVVKPMSSFLKHISVFSGSTILGDGSIALILDVAGLADFGKILGKKKQGDEREMFAKESKNASLLDVQEFLFFSVGTDSVHAIPLCLVQRLEEFEPSVIEFSGEQKVVRYRGSLLPLISLRSVLRYPSQKGGPAPVDESKRISVVVVQRSGRSFGIVVDEILDVVTVDQAIDDSIRDRDGVLGDLLHQERVVVVVDALGVIERATPGLKNAALGAGKSGGLREIQERNRDLKLKKIRVLYAEDVAFFRRHVSKVLNDAGMDVTTVEDGQKAIEELQNSPAGQYNLVLSDIEMPKMNGLELAAAVRKLPHFKSVPMIALTTRFRDKDVADGKAAGFDVYLEKLNPEKLLASIETVIPKEEK